jgi:hypothetical protein
MLTLKKTLRPEDTISPQRLAQVPQRTALALHDGRFRLLFSLHRVSDCWFWFREPVPLQMVGKIQPQSA